MQINCATNKENELDWLTRKRVGMKACVLDVKRVFCLCIVLRSWTYLEESEQSGLAVLEVTIPTGYFVLQSRLDEYVLSNLVPTLRRARYSPEKVHLYFDYVSFFFISFLPMHVCMHNDYSNLV